MPAAVAESLAELTAEVLRLKAEGVGSVPELELFGAGLHRDGEPPWTRDEIAAIRRNFAELSSGDAPRLPVVVGLDHAEGGPAVGRVSRLWEGPGAVLLARIDDLPRLWAEAIAKGLWFRVSAEIDPEPPFGLPGEGPCLVGMTLLGKARPQLKWTSDLTTLVRYAEVRGRRPAQPTGQRIDKTAGWRSVRRGRGYSVYSEATMDRATLLQQLVDAGLPQSAVDALDAAITDDAALGTFVNAYLAGMAGVGASGGTGGGGTQGQEGMTRDDVIAAILAQDPNQDRAALEAMTDEELKALLGQLGGTFRQTPAPGGATVPIPPPTTPAAAAQFAELRRVRADAAAAVAEAKKAAAAARSEAESTRRYTESQERKRLEAEIDTAVDDALKRGAVSPAEDDDSNPRLPPLRKRLRNSIGDRRVTASFSENGKTVTLTPLEVELERLKALPAGRYAERIPAAADAGRAKFFADLADGARKRYEAKHPKRAGTLAEQLGLRR